MSERIIQINDQLRREIAGLIAREIALEDGLITITRVSCSPDLRAAKVFISVLPTNHSGSALSLLKKHNSLFKSELRKKLRIKFIPKIFWAIDERERYAAEIDKVFDEISKNDAVDQSLS